ncbi:MAG TPA: ABC transporter substrate-binding protein [Thermoanaerobaculia bacterium]
MRLRPLVAIVLLLCIACGGGEKPAAPAVKAAAVPDDDRPRDGGTLNRRLDLDVATLNPIPSNSRHERYVTQLIFTPLIHIDRDLRPAPGLATSWEVSDDGLLYTFELNPKATFSDGKPVTARDVLFTLDRILDPASEAVQTAGSFVHLDRSRTRAVGDHTVEIAFRQANPTQLIKFNDVQVLPQHVYSKGNFRRDYNDTALGSGPYRLVRFVRGKEVVVERRQDYWEQKPYIQTVVFKIVQDHGTAFNALRRGDLDETIITSDTWIRESRNPESTKTIHFERFYTLNYNYIGWNNRHPLLRDKRVRRALSMSIPLDAIVNDLYHGTARAMSGPFTPDEWAYNPNVPVIRHDPEGAKKLFAEAGFVDKDGNGILEKDGRPFKVDLIVMQGSVSARQVAQMAQQELRKTGVDLNVVLMDGQAAIDRIMAGNFDAAYLSWELDPDPDPFNVFHSSQVPGVGQNFVYYNNPEADRLLVEARRELDRDKRRDLYWRLHEVMAEDQPYTWLIQVSLKWGVNKRVRGVVASRGFGYFLWSPGERDWWIAPGK